ncbi:unnamed protein product [Rotaria sordida]|uniref:Uncharacterized protein n=2 Tax=Rotaria sordida TaxID=392033 RepID=A0A814SWG0_9BILA|nr:unnamed protein product [Rotaria sordida]CAF4125601.1 unnamed protein product [Rotaria sordida]
MSQAGTGAWSCDVRLAFESYINMQICVCANNNCNDNIDTCRNSLTNSMNLSSSVDFIPNLTSIIQCNDTLNAPYICTEHSFINVSRCQDYIRNTSVLCAITVINSMITQRSLIYENYEIYLSEKVYQATSMFSNASNNSLVETATKIYYKYIGPAATPAEECACTNSLCNQNITICAPQTTITASFTSTTTSFTTATSSTSTTRSSSTSTTTSSTTATSSTATTRSSSTSTTRSSSTSTTRSSSTSTTTSSSTLTTRSSSTSTTKTSTQQNSVQGETGLGSAATAGLACGIIFSAVIFTGEIIFFKFFYSGAARSG